MDIQFDYKVRRFLSAWLMVGKLAVVVVEPRYRLSLPEVKKNDWFKFLMLVMYLKYRVYQ